MDLQHYPVISKNGLSFKFTSVGKKGNIEKVIIYSYSFLGRRIVFNLCFGDESFDDEIDDTSITNNGDREMVLRTVASTVLMITARHPDMPVHAIGATPSRTRLYQMGIAKNLKEIEKFLYISGKYHGRWVRFRKGINFTEFLVERKKTRYEEKGN